MFSSGPDHITETTQLLLLVVSHLYDPRSDRTKTALNPQDLQLLLSSIR